ncbi:tumor necrosis factor receptor superfamily member 14 [Candoia aspera]|uniref:tumor necrosis factor receptor superfamily member 14 n=1 Tax=Candoia aspera TaxID=51853 RepID=UPI002FD7B8CE
MVLMLRVVFAIHLLLLQDAYPCEMWEYSVGGECCPKCDAGHRVLRHCTIASGTSCVPCNDGWYTEHPNGLTLCFKCQECDPGAHLQIKEPCHYRKNTECICQPGFFCSHQLEEHSCDLCVKRTIAPPGFQVLQAGTETSDTKFEPCPPGTFSAREMSLSCTKWTNCSKKGLIEEQAGNATADAVCGVHNPPPRNDALILAIILPALLILGLIVIWIKRKYIMKAFGRKKGEEPGHTNPENECMVTPIQETTQNPGQPSYARS